MDVEAKIELSETISNLIENVACHVAQDRGGRITPVHLIPYLPMSLRLIEAGLDSMVNNQSVFSEKRDGFKEYTFQAYQGREPRKGHSEFEACTSCGKELGEWKPNLLCATCTKTIREELGRMATTNAWPAHAVWEHEFLYLAMQQKTPFTAEELASQTRFTLRNTRAKLKRLVLEGFARQDLDEAAALERFTVPEIVYPKERYRTNMEFIRQYPASLAEEVELKLVRITITLVVMIAAMLLLALARIPFPFLVGGFLVVAPIASIAIWRRTSAPPGGL